MLIANNQNFNRNLRGLYIPVQPTVKQSADKVLYQEWLPDIAVQPFIYCYWQLKTTETLKTPFNYQVVADGCIDIFFELNNPEKNFVMGFCKKYTQFPLENAFHYIGIRFLPTMFPQLFNINAAELSNRFAELETVVPSIAHFIKSNFQPNQEETIIKNRLDEYFKERIANSSFDDDSRLYEAIAIILKQFGVLNIESDLNTGLSPRQLRRLFKYYVGDSAKTFAKVVRFQNILRAKPSKQSLRQNKLFYEGYYDQAHFIKDFKNFYGVTPRVAFGR